MKEATRDTWNLVISIGALIISTVALIFSFMAYCGAKVNLAAEKRTEVLTIISEAKLLGERVEDNFEIAIQMRKEPTATDTERVKRVRANLKKIDKDLEEMYDVLNDYKSSTSVVTLEKFIAGARSCQKEYEYILEYIKETYKEVPNTGKPETSK